MPAIPPHDTPVVEGGWDGPAAKAAAPNDAQALRSMAAWRDPTMDPDLKGAYKEWHHAKPGGPAVLNGVRNALSRLPQAIIPNADRPGVEKHLQAHLAKQNQPNK